MSLVIVLLSCGTGILTGLIAIGLGDAFADGNGGQWIDWLAFALGVVFGLGVVALLIVDGVRSKHLKAWHLVLGTIVWIAALALGFYLWIQWYLLPGMG